MTKNYKIRGSIADIMRTESGGYRRAKAEALAKAGVLYRPAAYNQYLEKYLFKKSCEEKLLHYFDGEENFAEPDFVTKFFQSAAEARAAAEMLKIDMMTRSAEACTTSATTPVYSSAAHIDTRDIMPVYGKINSRYTATGLDYFRRLRASVNMAKSDNYKIPYTGIGMDCIQAAALARHEYAAYARAVAHLLPLSLASFDILLTDFGDYHKLERKFQYRGIQEVIDNDLNAGGTGRDSMTEAKSKKLAKLEAEAEMRWTAAEAAAKAAEARAAEASRSVTVDMVKTGDDFEALMLSILKKKSLVKIFILYADGVPMADIADIVGGTTKSVEHHIYRAKAKLAEAGIEAFLK